MGNGTMRALVYEGPGRRRWEEVPEPRVQQPTDAIVQVDATTICGTDLHILAGDVPTVDSGRVLGHEAVGTVRETGPAVTSVRPGDRVLVSCITACARCQYCRMGSFGQCLGGGGWILGHHIDGTQADSVRVPFADTSTYHVPAEVSDEAALMLADIMPTSYEVGVRNGHIKPGDTVAIVGAGPIGLAAVRAAQLYSPNHIAVYDLAKARVEAAKHFGADVTLDASSNPEQAVDDLTEGRGADVAIEAVGVPETFELCTRLVRPGGRVANIGVHGKPVTLHLEQLWDRDLTVTTGLVDTYSTPTLLRMLASNRLDTTPLITHRFDLDEMPRAYDTFAHPQETEALKVALLRDGH